jgi:hypothetical protein
MAEHHVKSASRSLAAKHATSRRARSYRRDSRIIKIRHICQRSASLYYACHQTSLKTEWFCANSGRWNLVIPKNNWGYCWSMRTIRTIFSTDFINTELAVIINLIPKTLAWRFAHIQFR